MSVSVIGLASQGREQSLLLVLYKQVKLLPFVPVKVTAAVTEQPLFLCPLLTRQAGNCMSSVGMLQIITLW